MSFRHPAVLVTGLVLGLCGCRETLSPRDVTGTYVLEQVGDDPLPAVVFRDGSGLVRIIADTLRLRMGGRGSFVSVRVIEHFSSSQLPLAASRLESELTYRIADARVEMTFTCPPNAMCAPGPHLVGERVPRGMIIEQTVLADSRLTYRRVGMFPREWE